MRIISGARQSGRTTELIKLAAEADKNGEVAYIVCHSQQEANRIARLASSARLDIRYPITFDEFLNYNYAGTKITKFFIDNAEYLLNSLSPIEIDTISIKEVDAPVEDGPITVRLVMDKAARYRVIDQDGREFAYSAYPGVAGDKRPELSVEVETGGFPDRQMFATVSFRVPVEVERS